MNLENRFKNLTANYYNTTSLTEGLWNVLLKKYTEPHRAYHNFKHLEELFKYFDVHQNSLEHPDIVAFSIFYHDVIYNIWKKDNEEKSAELATTELTKLNLPFVNSVAQQIIATKTHHATDNDTKYLVDFDLAILGQSEKTYQHYTQLIRKEYKLVPSLLYKSGRKKVLAHFLNKSSIYATEAFRSLYEVQARENLKNELNNI
ncbi:hypothetical protein [Tenacibaculum sp. 190524A02b]|uniref:HD domain-containing protein n=1 Tax=Tenacibaculum vairaonense TaxID=3137860 RepID=UPI0031FB002A